MTTLLTIGETGRMLHFSQSENQNSLTSLSLCFKDMSAQDTPTILFIVSPINIQCFLMVQTKIEKVSKISESTSIY